MYRTKRPGAAGLYVPTYEHDACGVGAIADLSNERTHATVSKALWVLDHLEHRGASGAEIDTGDGAGILLQVPDELLRAEASFELPPAGEYAVGVVFLPDHGRTDTISPVIERVAREEGLDFLGWRDVPVDHDVPGPSAAAVEPIIRQFFVTAPAIDDQDALERKVYVVRRLIEKEVGDHPDFAIASFSSRRLVYKGMLTSPQLPRYFPDLRDERAKTALALVHSRFSTNTFPSWELAHPYRLIAHNGEINTLRGNVNWMRARESQLLCDAFGDDLKRIIPVVQEGHSDSSIFDQVLELLFMAGRSLPHALMMMIPEAWEGRADMDPWLKDFYAYHSCLMEPWDGPAAVAFTDGRCIGATLDRNGLRPGRWQVTKDGFVVLASETGVLEAEPSEVVKKGRLQPGKIFYVDVENGRIVDDGEIKHAISHQQPYGEWYRERTVHLDDMEDVAPRELPRDSLVTRQLMFGYSQEDAHQLVISQPLLSSGELEKLRQVDHHIFKADTLDATWPADEGVEGLAHAMKRLCEEADASLAKGDNILIISDRAAGADRVP